MLKDRVVIPESLRSRVLSLLHAAHQGVEGMRQRTASTVYWPGHNNWIREKQKKLYYL